MNVKFFTEGGSSIGYGHLTRCYAVSKEFEVYGIATTLYINLNSPDNNVYKTSNNTRLADWLSDKKLFKESISKNDIIIIDSYQAQLWHFQYAYKQAGLCIVFDDTNRLPYPGGIVVNGAVAAKSIGYPKNNKINYLLGIEYQPVRNAFLSSNGPKKVNPDIENIFISLGGSDIHNISVRIIEAVKLIFKNARIHLVATKNYNIPEIKKTFGDSVIIYTDISADKMSCIANNCDLALLAAGQTLYEIILTQTPIIAIGIAKNQEINVKGWLQLGLIDFVGWWDDPKLFENLTQKCLEWQDDEKRENYIKTAENFKNSLPEKKLIKSILKSFFQKVVTVKPAVKDNMMDLFHLANDPEVRNSSFRTSTIHLPEHQNWFDLKLNDQNCLFLIVYINREFAGQIRFDMENKKAVVNISIEQKFRGQGLGPIALPKAIEVLKKTHPSLDIVIAHVKIDNDGSRFLFLKAGFDLLFLKDNIYTFVLYFKNNEN